VRAVAEAIATEWALQGQTIDPETMPLTRLANSIIDGVAVTPMPVATEIEKYLGTDLLFYRAGEPEGLVARQREHWDPVVEWAREIFGARFVLAEGVIHVAQPPAAIAAAAAAIPLGTDDAASAWRLGALSAVTTICGSALLALALAAGRLAPEQVWAAAHVDEDWNIEKWGRDESVMERRAQRNTEFLAAAKVLALLR
jgi:chaperone required for assembly of F1-ATPase